MSKLIGLTILRNEQWIAGFSMRVALQWVDEIIAFDHRSSDNTRAIIEGVAKEYPDRVHLVECFDERWNEMEHRQQTLEHGRTHGGTHFAIVDADEVLTANLLETTRECVLMLDRFQLYSLPMIPMWRSMKQYRDDGSVWSRATISLAFADGPGVTWRPRDDGYQFHNRVPERINVPNRKKQRHNVPRRPMSWGGVLHLQWACWLRMQWKHCLYQITETIQHPGRRTARQLAETYSMASNEDGLLLSAAPKEWLAPYEQWFGHINLNDEPWQATECRRLIAEHGRKAFAGLNFFGLL